MGFITKLFEQRSDTIAEAVQNFLSGDDDYPTPTASGTYITESNSLGVSAVWACVRLISRTLASLPLHYMRRLDPRGKERATDNPLYALLHDSPNPEQTSYKWRELMSTHQNLWGAGISEIEFDAAGEPVGFWPIPPWRIELKRTPAKELFYRVYVDNGFVDLPQFKVLVFSSMQTSTDKWLSPISVHRETIGAAAAVKEFGARTFGQGTNPAAILSGIKFPKDTTEESLREKFLKKYAGLNNAHRLMLLEDGVKFDRIGLPPEDAQYLETRKFDIAEIARIFSVPLNLIQEHEKSTSWGTGLEEMNSGFVTFTMRPDFVLWEQEFKKKVIFEEAGFVEFSIEGLLRGKLSERYAAYAIGRQWGWLSPNDIRDLENYNPLPEDQGDLYLVPMNMVDAKNAGKENADESQVQTKEPAK